MKRPVGVIPRRFISLITAAGFGSFSPLAAILSTTFVIIAFGFLGIFTALTTAFVFLAAVMGMIIGFLVRR